MANRTQKAAMKKKADAGKAERAKAPKKGDEVDFEEQRARELLEKEAAKGRKAKGKDGKAKEKAGKPGKAPKPPKGTSGKGRARKKEGADETSEPEPQKPGFMERWRARREERAKERQAEAERRAVARAAEEARQAVARAEAEEKARKEAEERAAAEAVAAAAAEKERKKQERRDAAAEAKRQAEMAEAIKEAESVARKEERRLKRQAERAAIEERERQAAEEAEAADRRREAERLMAAQEKADAKAAKRAAAAAAEAAAEEAPELEPEMEFQEGSRPVDPARALVVAKDKGKAKAGQGEPAEPPATPTDSQADKVAEELARRRSKPVVIVADEDTPAIPRIPKAEREEPAEPLVLTEPVVDEKYQPAAPAPPPPSGLSIPEMFLLVANAGVWDERAEMAKPGHLGGALAGAIFLELLQRGRILVQRDRFTVVGEPGDDQAVEAAVARVRSIRERKGDISSLPHMRRVAKWNRELLEPFKDRLAERGLVRHEHHMHLGLFYRSSVELLDPDAQERLQNKLRRAIAGGGTPEATSILLLGLLDACGLLETIVPDEAMDYNRKRLNGLLAGRDVMGYKVDPHLKSLQEVAIRTVLQNVRLMA